MLTPFCLTALSRSLLTSDRTNPEAVQVLAMAQGGMDSSLIYLAPHPCLFAVVNLAIRTYLPIPAIRPMRSLLKYQLVNFSNGTPLMSVAAQISQPFKPTASAVRVNVLWFLSLVLSVTCALSATLMQQWARRYQELAQHHGAPHRRGCTRAYIFDGISRFGMARAVATMPTLLHISVFLFFAGLIDFLFPIDTTVSYFTLGLVVAFALTYAILTVLLNLYLNCPYATLLSGFTWRLSSFS